MIPDPDDDLRARFATMRRHDFERAPAFEGLAAPARPALVRSPVARVAFGLALISAVAIVSYKATRDTRRPPAVSIAQWIAPTDFLLRTPGVELVTSSPSLVPIIPQRIQLP